MAKKLEKNSQYAKYDLDGDGIVTDEEFDMDQKCTEEIMNFITLDNKL